jgi:hypothetical protein
MLKIKSRAPFFFNHVFYYNLIINNYSHFKFLCVFWGISPTRRTLGGYGMGRSSYFYVLKKKRTHCSTPPLPPQRDKSELATINPARTKVRALLFRAHIQMFPVVHATLKAGSLRVKFKLIANFSFGKGTKRWIDFRPTLDSLPTGFAEEYKFDFWHMGRVLGRCLWDL